MEYKPSTDQDTAQARATMYRRIRAFFHVKSVLEVDTPILSHTGVTDVQLQSVAAHFTHQDNAYQGYLHTSPEFAMKRLVAAWQTPIYQITKAFRDNEQGSKHNIEFAMLEWYRPEFSLDELADELNQLLQVVFDTALVFDRISYQQAFLDYADIEPFSATLDELEQVAILRGIDSTLGQKRTYLSVMADTQNTKSAHQSVLSANTVTEDAREQSYAYAHQQSPETRRTAWLDLLYSHLVEPNLGKTLPTLIYDFPAEQAALAKTEMDASGNLVAKRFELYIDGVELANAYDELTDVTIQHERFIADNLAREKQGLPQMPIDQRLLSALTDMPSCAGVSVGLDRLLMVMLGKSNIADVINFTTDNS